MEPAENAWLLEFHPRFLRDARWYARRRPGESEAVMRNLTRYQQMLHLAPNPRTIRAGFIHPEPHGMVALDESGSRGSLQATRLYCHPDAARKILRLLAIGSKATQTRDLAQLIPLARSLNAS